MRLRGIVHVLVSFNFQFYYVISYSRYVVVGDFRADIEPILKFRDGQRQHETFRYKILL
jgi:hypothetical protein